MGKKDDDKLLKSLGEKLREIRHQKGWTLEETEEHGWTSWKHLQRIESGKNVTILTLNKLAKLYQIQLKDIFTEI